MASFLSVASCGILGAVPFWSQLEFAVLLNVTLL